MDSEPAAAATQPEKQLEEMLQNLTMDAAPKQADAAEEPAKDGSSSEGSSSVSSLGDVASIKDGDVEQEVIVEHGPYYPPSNCYGLYYSGYEAPGSEWDEHGCFVGTDGLEIQYPGIQPENGSLVYYMPGYGYHHPVYNPYNPYIPGALIGVDGQYLGHQPYYPGPIYPPSVSSAGYFQPPVQYGSDVLSAYSWESVPLLVDRANANGFNGSTTGGSPRPGYSVASVPQVSYVKGMMPAGKPSTSALDSKGSVQTSEGLQSPPVSAGQATSQGNMSSTGFQAPGARSFSKIPQQVLPIQAPVLPKGYVPLGKLAASSNQGKPTVLYSNNSTDFKPNGRGWIGGDRLKLRGKANGNGNLDVLTEQNRGPRINKMRNPWSSPGDAGVGSQGVVGISEGCSPAINRDQYNQADFSIKFDNALFFVIKSYSEDDVHKSIKYNVWASTPNGNKRLDAAYQVAQERSGANSGSCPVFLFFSVNASGQFCGVAEMVGAVDFDKSMNFWQQDKWSGYFPVKWHMIKDIPNSQFRHIILENNDNKPVTNSRDTQEIKYAQGMEMLNIFKNYLLKTSILDDFMYYESRQKTMQDKKMRQPMQQQEHLQIAAQVDASIQLKQLNEDIKVNTPLDPSSAVSSANGGQSLDSNVKKKTVLGSPSVKKDENVPSNVVDSKKNEIKGAGGESPSVLKSGPLPS